MILGNIPFLSEEEIQRRAEALLEKHHPSRTVPVPIEEIVEFALRLDLIPVPGLSENRGINGYLSSDRSSIYVDEYLFRNVETRYRFTLAHEVGHLVLHGALYGTFSTEEDWRAFHRALSSHVLDRAEFQADYFANCLLAPRAPLLENCRRLYADLSAPVLAESPDFDLGGEAFWSMLADRVGRALAVHRVTTRIAMEREGLWRRPDQM